MFLLTAKPMLGCSLFTPNRFWPSYCQILTDLDKILHTPVVVLNKLVGWLRPRSALWRLQAKPERLFFVIFVTHPKSYTCRDDGSARFWRRTVKVEMRTGAIVKNSGILYVRSQIQKQHFFSRFGVYPSTILRTAYRKQFYPKPMVPTESRDSEGVPFASLESLWPGIWQI